MNDMVKINFHMEQDEDGYPPASTESLWARPLGIGYAIDSIPFFVKEVTNEDIVSAKLGDGEVLWFDKCIKESNNSLIRIVFFEKSEKDIIDKYLKKTGCKTEFISDYGIMAVNVPGNVSYNDVIGYISTKGDAGLIDYEEAVIRQ